MAGQHASKTELGESQVDRVQRQTEPNQTATQWDPNGGGQFHPSLATAVNKSVPAAVANYGVMLYFVVVVCMVACG